MSALLQLAEVTNMPLVRRAFATAQHNLFEEVSPPVMPSVQFLGNKEKLLPWIFSFIPASTFQRPLRFLDGFSGSAAVSFEAKRRGFQVTSNDMLQSCWQSAAGLVENGTATLSLPEAERLFEQTDDASELMRRLFAGRFFSESEAGLLDFFALMWRLCPQLHEPWRWQR